MKRVKIIVCLLLISCMSRAQDKIITHNGDTILCKVIEVTSDNIRYGFPSETSTNTLSKNVTSEVIYSSGRREKISDKIFIQSEKDWEKVQVTNSEAEVKGLHRIGEIHVKASSGWSTTGAGKMQKKAMEKLKRQAAEKGAHIVLVLTQTSQNGSYGLSGGAKASMSGTAYSYR